MTPEKPPLYCSFDIEADGTNPTQHSMLGLGATLFSDATGIVLIDTFECSIAPQQDENKKDFVSDQKTMDEFWKHHPKQLEFVRTNTQSPKQAMQLFANWLRKYDKYDIKWVARPANFDWMWLKCYYEKYGPQDRPDIGYYCHCLSSLIRAYCLTHNIYDQKKFILALSGNYVYTHRALDDAMAQGICYMNLRRLFNNKCSEKIDIDEKGMTIVTRRFDFTIKS